MILYPNAKINIGLNIIKKRADDFHDIESVFYPLWHTYDVLEIVKDSLSESISFTTSGLKIDVNTANNLCVKAYALMKKNHAIGGVKIHLHKRIPMGAGLGGGSSDAAFVLKGINELFGLNLSNEILIRYAATLGSDCAFFIANQPVFASAKGDVFSPITLDLEKYDIKVTYPNIHISTPEAYSMLTPKSPKNKLTTSITLPMKQWRETIINDFEEPIFLLHPSLKQIKQDFYNTGAIYAAMSGSGSAIYGLFEKNNL